MLVSYLNISQGLEAAGKKLKELKVLCYFKIQLVNTFNSISETVFQDLLLTLFIGLWMITRTSGNLYSMEKLDHVSKQ